MEFSHKAVIFICFTRTSAGRNFGEQIPSLAARLSSGSELGRLLSSSRPSVRPPVRLSVWKWNLRSSEGLKCQVCVAGTAFQNVPELHQGEFPPLCLTSFQIRLTR